MKHYRKIHEDICDIENWGQFDKSLGATTGSIDELVARFKSFYKDAHEEMFDAIVKEIWLEQQITVRGMRRMRRFGNGHKSDLAFGKFTKIAVGASHRVLTANFCFTPIVTYLADFFPEFLFHDPFKNPEKYKYPFENIRLDFLTFVYQMDERLELLEYAEKKQMSYAEFINWVVNWALSNNLDRGEEKYKLRGNHSHWVYILNTNKKRNWQNDMLSFNTK
jgi:hypothetical protein